MELDVVCVECNGSLDASTDRHRSDTMIVDRCECKDKEISKLAYDEGYDEGCSDAEDIYEPILEKYRKFLDRLGIEYDPDKDG